MITFLRKLRQGLLSNKFGSYLLYAFGEIILVVVGILIALQINNANDQRKSRQELNEYLHKIADNVKDDLIQIERLQIRRDTVRERAMTSLQTLKAKDFSNIRDIYRGQSVFFEFYFIPNLSGYEALKNSPFLGKINNTKVDSLLSLYYARIDKIQKDEIGYNTFIENMEANLNISEDVVVRARLFDRFRENPDFNINEFQDILPYIKNKAFQAAVYRTVAERTYIGNYPALTEAGTALIEEIEAFSKQK